MIYELVGPTDPALTRRVPEFDFSDPPVDPSELGKDLLDTMFRHNGFGLSANQCGLVHRVFVMKAELPFVCFNPKIVMTSEEMVALEEACLSFPGLVFNITRPRHVRVRFATPSGVVTTKTFTGMTARCVQHEMMHLDGKLFFEGQSRLKIEKAIKNAKKAGVDYSGIGLLKHAA